MSLSDVFTTLSGLAVIGGGVLLLATFARDPQASEHDLPDYHEPDEVTPYVERLTQADLAHLAAVTGGLKNREVFANLECGDILPPAPPGMNAGSPLYAGMLFDTWHPESPADTADRFLREIGDQAKAKTADRDLTGAFPVVAVA